MLEQANPRTFLVKILREFLVKKLTQMVYCSKIKETILSFVFALSQLQSQVSQNIYGASKLRNFMVKITQYFFDEDISEDALSGNKIKKEKEGKLRQDQLALRAANPFLFE